MNAFGTSPADSLSEEHKTIRTLTQLLQLEQEHLIAIDIDGISALTEPKAKATAYMTELATLRHRALTAAGFPASEAGMKTWLKTANASATVRESWRELIELAKAAKELNRVNGTLINKQMVRNQSVLGILQHNVQGNHIYGPNGQTAHKATGRHIVA
jgi:flagella synthesis protein FlgN